MVSNSPCMLVFPYTYMHVIRLDKIGIIVTSDINSEGASGLVS